MCLQQLIAPLNYVLSVWIFFGYHLLPWNSKPPYLFSFFKEGERILFEFWMKSLFFNPWITSSCRFYAARDMCHPVTVRLPQQQRSRSWYSTITIVSISILLVTDWMALKSHMPLCLFSFPMCVVQENPNSRTFILLYLRILILFSHTHSIS